MQWVLSDLKGFCVIDNKHLTQPDLVLGCRWNVRLIGGYVVHLGLSADELTLAVVTFQSISCFSLCGTDQARKILFNAKYCKEKIFSVPLKYNMKSFGWHPQDPKTFLVMDNTKQVFTVNFETKKTVTLRLEGQLSSPPAYGTIIQTSP